MKLANRQSRLTVCLICVFSALFLTAPVVAGDFEEYAKLTVSDPVAGQGFGNGVSVRGDLAVIGAYSDPHAGDDSGAAYVFRRSGLTWTEEQRLTASDPGVYDYFGYAAAVEDDVILIGSMSGNRGAVYFYRYDGSAWVQEQKLTASDTAVGDFFGDSISLEGDSALIGAPGNGVNGAAYFFHYDGSTWSEGQQLTAGGTTRWFGSDVALSGTTALVGARDDDHAGSGAGSAYVFRFNGTSWNEEQKLTASDASEQDNFGIAVALEGEVALVGAPYAEVANPHDGAVYAFRFDGLDWNEEQKLVTSGADQSDHFGLDISLQDETALIGAPDDDGGLGSAYVFAYEGSTWIEKQRLEATDGDDNDRFGGALSLDGGTAIIGAYGDDDIHPFGGAAYVFGPGCLPGTVNSGQGSVTDALYVNGSWGGSERTVTMTTDDLLVLTILQPPAGGSGKFVIHADPGSVFSWTPLPANIGITCLPFLLRNSATPVIVANCIGKTNLVGESHYYGNPLEDPAHAPTSFSYYDSLPSGAVLTLQGVILDPASSSTKGASTTNAVILEVH